MIKKKVFYMKVVAWSFKRCSWQAYFLWYVKTKNDREKSFLYDMICFLLSQKIYFFIGNAFKHDFSTFCLTSSSFISPNILTWEKDLLAFVSFDKLENSSVFKYLTYNKWSQVSHRFFSCLSFSVDIIKRRRTCEHLLH